MCLRPIRVKGKRSADRLQDIGFSPASSIVMKNVLSMMDSVADRNLGYRLVPCGRCEECRRARRNSWRTRLFHESYFGGHRRALFVTLTISPHYYPFYKDNPAKAIRRFTDLIRKTYGVSQKYFMVTELGGENGRLHFHGIIWDPPFLTARDYRRTPSYKAINRRLRHFWKIGATWVGWVDGRTANYIVKYITKPCDFDPDFRPSVFCSPGIGSCYLTERIVSDIRKQRNPPFYVNANGYRCSMPRYYLTKIFTPLEYVFLSASCRVLSPPDPLYFHGDHYPSIESLRVVQNKLFRESVSLGLSSDFEDSYTYKRSLNANLDFNNF